MPTITEKLLDAIRHLNKFEEIKRQQLENDFTLSQLKKTIESCLNKVDDDLFQLRKEVRAGSVTTDQFNTSQKMRDDAFAWAKKTLEKEVV